ncbi:TDT family transporter [Corynebacterium amycolatum]|uniref:TDT family transporter n=1 Tax=Corynebacterium amycolatum TaxID=43765 RepID=UPI001FCB3345|nr:TDT family transporter [Corynebacterium amycolatum]
MTNSSRRDVLAPAGPAWAGSLMGTSIFATLAHIHDVPMVPELLLIVAVSILGFIVVGWLRLRNPPFHSKLMAPWGMLSMGIMALGSSASSVFNDSAWQRATWWIGAPLAIYVSLRQLRGFEGEPTFQWGLALVAPMVAATSGAQLSVDYGTRYHVCAQVFFCMALITVLPIFVRCYVALFSGIMRIPDSIAGTAWIPLGLVGQSTAAAQLLFNRTFAVAYGTTVLIVGLFLAAIALRRFTRAVIRWAGYSPGWWGATFPVGTLSLGTHSLGDTADAQWLYAVSAGLLCLLAVHWCVCVARFGWWARELAVRI